MRRTLYRLLPVLALASATLSAPAGAHALPVLEAATPGKVTFGASVVATGAVTPAAAGEQVQLDQQQRDGSWRKVGALAVTDASGAWRVTFRPRHGGAIRATQLTGAGGTSGELAVHVAAKVFPGRLARGPVYPFLGAKASWRVAPATYPSGLVRIELSIDGRSAGFVRARVRAGVVAATVPTRGVGRFRARLVLPERGGFTRSEGPLLAFSVRGARVGSGSSAPWVRSLRAALKFRGFHVPARGGFDARMGDSVIAFHKAYRRPRTTTFEASDWVRLTKRRVAARDRSAALHLEIDKSRQILMQVKNGRPVMIIHISSGSTGNTPAGRHRIQWKGDWVPSLYGSLLYKSMAFQGAYAIHGYPSVPTSPASHGCVRVPMWIASALYRRTPVGTPVYVYEGPGSTAVSVGRAAAGTAPDVPELTGVDASRWADET